MAHSQSRNPKRIPARLGSKLEKDLWTYAAMAGAAGVGILAGPPVAEARIVYTPAHASVTPVGYSLDVNHDGIVDFNFVPGVAVSIGGSSRWSYLAVCHIAFGKGFSHQCVESSSMLQTNKDNVVRILSSGAAALADGAKIADGEKFANPGVGVLMAQRAYFSGSRTTQHWDAPWANGGKGTKNRYLGFKFKINGEFHYGWARLTVNAVSHGRFTATLTGYAYETIPNKGIVAGQTSGPDEVGALEPAAANVDTKAAYRPASLGMLGLGALGLSIWRREDSLGM
ncbi:MAG TPA: hypothetical protein VI386_10770 [Candidatus Sulfotelmatobacter sp.]